MKEIEKIITCPITSYKDAFTYLDLGEMPLVNNLCNTREDSLNCKKYPLRVQQFENSKLSTLTHAVDGKLLFSNYLFKSEVNIPYINHCERMFDYISGLIKLTTGDLIIDIGGNDGTLLHTFKKISNKQLNYLNIDPSKNLAQLSISKGIDTLTEFFTKETSNLVKGKAKIITSTNVFQHLKNIDSFVDGVNNVLADDGLWILEFPYWLHDLHTDQFDQVYHEHIYYYTVTPLNELFIKHNLKIIRIEKQNIHGGTLRLVMAKKDTSYEPDSSIIEYLDTEKMYDSTYYKNWGVAVKSKIAEYKKILQNLKTNSMKTPAKIIAFGAAAKGCIFLNAAEIDYTLIDFIIDDTDIKQNKYMPGTGIEIVSRNSVNFSDIDYILILTHNFAEHISKSIKEDSSLNFHGKFITVLPTLQIYE